MTDWHPPLVDPEGGGRNNRAAQRRAQREAEKTWPKTYSEDSPLGPAYVPSDLGPIYLPPFSAFSAVGIQQCYLLNYQGKDIEVLRERGKIISRINAALRGWK